MHIPYNRTLMILVALVASTTFAHASDDQVMGIGSQTCQVIKPDAPQDDATPMLIAEWIQGYLSAVSIFDERAELWRDKFHAVTQDDLLSYVRAYCKMSPKRPINDVANDLVFLWRQPGQAPK